MNTGLRAGLVLTPPSVNSSDGNIQLGLLAVAGRVGTINDVDDAIALGTQARATHSTAVALGKGATTTAVNQIMMGTATEQVYVPGTLRIPTGGSLNKVLTSDANGVASWATATGGGGETDPVVWMGGF